MVVATVLTVYGIETSVKRDQQILRLTLQQYLPFTVLKRCEIWHILVNPLTKLQQYLPFTVLKLPANIVACVMAVVDSCNSTYRLRY